MLECCCVAVDFVPYPLGLLSAAKAMGMGAGALCCCRFCSIPFRTIVGGEGRGHKRLSVAVDFVPSPLRLLSAAKAVGMSAGVLL